MVEKQAALQPSEVAALAVRRGKPCSAALVRHACDIGRLPHRRTETGVRLIARSDAEAWIATRRRRRRAAARARTSPMADGTPAPALAAAGVQPLERARS